MFINDYVLAFDDITLVPQYSTVRSRNDPDTSVSLGNFDLKIPIISSNMDTVTEHAMAVSMFENGGIGALHRFMTIDENVKQYNIIRDCGADCWVSVGVKYPEWVERFSALFSAGARNFIVDVAHGHSVLVKETVQKIRKNWSDIVIMAGNISTREAASDLIDWGVDILKVGIGPGSCCKTRVVTGHGIPMFTSIQECAYTADQHNKLVIADGGIRSSGDIVKALYAGASAVMLGSLLSGTKETPGVVETKIIDGVEKKYKKFRGMASTEARLDHKMVTQAAVEGVSSYVPYKGKVDLILSELIMGLKSGMSYCNAGTLGEIQLNAKHRLQTHSGHVEGTPHIFSIKS